MRIEQLEYLEVISRTGSINEAAKQLYLTQPSLSNAIKELEREMGIQILRRSKLGVSLTEEGREFLIYGQQIMDNVALLKARYSQQSQRKQTLAISAQHYAFVVHAFVELIRQVTTAEYQFTLRETETQNILEDVAGFKSELGVLYLNEFNAKVMMKLFKDYDLTFYPLFKADPHVFVGRDNPLTAKQRVSLDDLEPYPYLSYEQGAANSFYFAEEILSTLDRKKHIKVSDRATIFNLMVGLNGYTISSGIISSELNDDKIVAIPLATDDSMTLGWVKNNNVPLSPLGKDYLSRLRKHIAGYGFDIIANNQD